MNTFSFHEFFFSVFTYYWKGQELSRLIQTYGSVNVKLEKGSHCQSISRGSGPFANFNQTEGVFCQPEVSTYTFVFTNVFNYLPTSYFNNFNLTNVFLCLITGYLEMERISTAASTTKSILELEFDFHS